MNANRSFLEKLYQYISNNISRDNSITLFLRKNLLVTKKEIKVFRGHSKDAKLRLNFESFFSTSIDPSVAKLFSENSNNIYKIKIPVGTSVLFIDSYEQELILGPGFLKKIDKDESIDYIYISK